MTTANGPGRIITFYSYKGGTGRTMLLANVAWILAANGNRVLVVDWDLEAPGLHRYLHPFLVDPELTATEGVIDFVTDYAVRAMTPGDAGASWWLSLADVSRYAVSLEHEGFPDGATLDFAPAGRQGEAYASRVNSFNWQDFYNRLGGGAFLDAVRDKMRADYDYVLVDSRTGVSDTAGICTVQLPDALVVCFTLNTQSIEGAAAVAESVCTQRGLPVFPVPTRIEFAEKQKLDAARDRVQRRFGPLLTHLDADGRDSYWGRVEVIYQPFYAYEEVLATFADQPGQPNSVLAAVERLTDYVTGGKVKQLVPPSPADRQRVLARFSGQPEALTPVPAEAAASRDEVAALTRRLEEKEQEVAALAAAQARESETGSHPPGGRNSRRRRVILSVVVISVLAGAAALFATSRGGEEEVDLHPAVAADPNSLDFGLRAFGDATEMELTVTPTDAGPVEVASVTVDGSPDFGIHEDGCSGKELGVSPEGQERLYEESCVVGVGFDPGRDGQGPGHRHGMLVIRGPWGNLDVELKGCKEHCGELSES